MTSLWYTKSESLLTAELKSRFRRCLKIEKLSDDRTSLGRAETWKSFFVRVYGTTKC